MLEELGNVQKILTTFFHIQFIVKSIFHAKKVRKCSFLAHKIDLKVILFGHFNIC